MGERFGRTGRNRHAACLERRGSKIESESKLDCPSEYCEKYYVKNNYIAATARGETTQSGDP
jgi:hypothetical protein